MLVQVKVNCFQRENSEVATANRNALLHNVPVGQIILTSTRFIKKYNPYL
jgi:hypothetical protein